MPSYSQYKRQMAVMDADDANIETWITVKGNHIPIMKGQSKEEAVQSFLEKKGKSSSGAKPVDQKKWDKAYEDAKKTYGPKTLKNRWPSVEEVQTQYKANEKPAKPDKNADVSDLVSSYKKQMKELGPNASIKKIDRVQANAIKEFMGRKLGPGRKYDDYYNYWLNGMSKKDSDIFEQIYTESEARERAFSELSGGKYWAEDPSFMKEMSKGKKTTEKPSKSKMPKIDEKADVSDIVKQYKADMKALGKNASLAKRDKVEVNAIKEFMRRKVGAGHPYNDYYDYWLSGMSDKDKESFNSIYGESVNREKAFEALSKEKDKPANKGKSSGGEKTASFNTTTKVPSASREEFMKSQKKKYDTVTGTENGTLLSLYYEKGSKPSNHVGTYNHQTGEYFHNTPSAEKPANKGWLNARSSHPETIGKVVRRVVKKMGEARDVPDVHGEYKSEIARLQNKAARMRKMGQGATAIKLEEQAEKLYKEMRELDD